jgi:cell division protein FtsL
MKGCAAMRNKKIRTFRIERTLIKFCLILLVIFPVLSVISKAALSNMNLEVERIKKDIVQQEKKNESLSMKVDELKSLANIQTIVESEGLSYNSSKIKVIANR